MNFAKNRRIASVKSLEDDELSLTGSNETYFDSEEDTEYKPKSKRLRSSDYNGKKTEDGGHKIQRKPTRIPDSKVTNRNALLARENRKRKKEMMESMEQTCTDLENENKRLQKMMKFKEQREKKLLREIQYLKSVITNQTDIVSVLKSLPQQLPAKQQPQMKKKESVVKEIEIKKEAAKPAGITSKASSVTLSCDAYSSEDGIKDYEDPFLPAIIDEFLFTDLNLDVATDWDEILQNPFSSATDFTDIPKFEMGVLSPASSPITEHNYSHSSDEQLSSSDNDGPGVCIHVRKGKVSLEFCSVCHFNATSAWVENIN
jgi:hypothetical protein